MPRGVKRGSAEKAAGAVAKKQCAEVVAAIGMSDELPDSCKAMVQDVAQGSLTVFAADRHAYQAQGVKMVGETLAGVQKQLQAAVDEFQAKVGHEDAEKAARATAADSAQQSLTALEQKASAAHEAVNAGKTAVASAKTNLATVEEELGNKEAEVASVTAKKTKLETAMTSAYETLKASAEKVPGGPVRLLKSLQAALLEVGLEAGLVDSVPETLRKAPEERGTFDGLVQKHVEAGASKCMGELEEAIKAAELAKPKLAEAKTAAETALTTSQEQVAAMSAALTAAEAAVKEGKEALKAATHAVTNFAKEAATAGKSLENAKSTLSSFLDGALKAFTDLKDLAPPPPEPEEPAAATEGSPAKETAAAGSP